ncbi:YSIRK-type signal peptide-containing protein, partial [Streptococcus suis]|nr:YSIRK-type signal peptide-containing protein [Streptococcus suis]
MKQRKSFNWYATKQRFSIRKYHFGAASVLLGLLLIGGVDAQAADLTTSIDASNSSAAVSSSTSTTDTVTSSSTPTADTETSSTTQNTDAEMGGSTPTADTVTSSTTQTTDAEMGGSTPTADTVTSSTTQTTDAEMGGSMPTADTVTSSPTSATDTATSSSSATIETATINSTPTSESTTSSSTPTTESATDSTTVSSTSAIVSSTTDSSTSVSSQMLRTMAVTTNSTATYTDNVEIPTELQAVADTYQTNTSDNINSLLETKLNDFVSAYPKTADYVNRLLAAYPNPLTPEEQVAFVNSFSFDVTSKLNEILANYDTSIIVKDPIQYGPTATTQAEYDALVAEAEADYQKQLADKDAKIAAYEADLARYYAEAAAALAAKEEGKPVKLITKNSFVVGDESLATISNITISDSSTAQYLSYVHYLETNPNYIPMTTEQPVPSPDGLTRIGVVQNAELASRGAKTDAQVAKADQASLATDIQNYPYASGFNFAVKDGAEITVEYNLTGNSTIEIDGVPTPIDRIRVTYTVTNQSINDPNKPWASYTIYRDPRFGSWLGQAGATNDRSKTIHSATYELIVDGQIVPFPADAYTTGSSLNIGEASQATGEPIFINGSAIGTSKSTVNTSQTWQTSVNNTFISYTASNYNRTLNPNFDSSGQVIDSIGPIPLGAGFIDKDGIVRRWDDYTSDYSYKGRVIYEIPQGQTDMSLTHNGSGGGWLILFTDVPIYEIDPVIDLECEIQPYFVAFETSITSEPQVSADVQGMVQTETISANLSIVPKESTFMYTFEDGGLTLKVDGQGSYIIDRETGNVTFTPEASFVGTATPVVVVATASFVNVDGNTSSLSTSTFYTPTVYGISSISDDTSGPQGLPQTSITGAERFNSLNDSFNTTLGDDTVTIPSTNAYSLVNADGIATLIISIQGEGTYTIDANTGIVTFQPEATFVGVGTGVIVRVNAVATDSEGNLLNLTSENKYVPEVTPVTPTAVPGSTEDKQGQAQQTDASSLFTAGDALVPIDATSITLLDESGQPATEVPAKDADGNVVGNYVLNPDGTVTFTPNPDFVGTPVPITIQAKDANGTPVTTSYTPTVTPVTPTAVPESTEGKQGQAQSTDANALFTEGDPVAPIDATSITLLDESGQPATEVPAKDSNGNVVGNYVLNSDGTVTFTPDPDFVGTPVPVTIQAKDANGTPVTTSYTPTVTPVTPTAVPESTEGKQGQ